jgi:hypothetical protein
MSDVHHGKFGTVEIGGVTMEVTSWSVSGVRSDERLRRRLSGLAGSVTMTVHWPPPPAAWWDMIGGWYEGRPGFRLADALRPSRN